MADVDPVSMTPKVLMSSKTDAKKVEALERNKAEGMELRDDLDTNLGNAVVRKVREHLLKRVNKLIDDDPECRALKRLLVDIGVTINIGENAVENLMRMVKKP